MKIQTKISSIILMVILLMAATVITVTALVSKNMIKQEIYNRLENVAASRAHHIETLLNEEKELVEMLATDQVFVKAVTSKKGESANERINTLIPVYDEISRISILDKQGNVVASNHVGIDTKGDADIFAHGKKGVYIRDIHISAITGTIVFSMSAPILVNGEFAGIVITNIEAETVLYKITTDRTGLGETGEIYLINKAGYMITPSRVVKDTFLTQKVTSPEAREWLELSEKEAEIERLEVDIYDNYSERQVIGTHRAIQEQWCLLAEIEVVEALAPVNQLVRIMLWCFVIFAGMGIILTIFITETITYPIMVLHTKVQKIEEGDWECQLTVDTTDEIGQLSKAFDRMTACMKNSHQALQRHRDELENKVAERTAELAQHLATSHQQKQVIQEIALDFENTNERLILEIEERKQAEEKLRDSEERFRKIFEEGPLGMIITNPHYQLVKPNKAFCQMLGYSEQELVGLTIADVTHPEDMPKSQKQVKQLINGKFPSFQMEKRYLTKEGQIVWGHITVSGFCDDNNVPLYFLGMVEDITERKHADQKLRESETRIRTILENIVDGVITINEQGIIESFNRAAEQIFGYSVEEVIGQNINILMPEPYRSQHDNYLTPQRLQKVIGVVREVQGQHQDGSIFPLDLAVNEMWLGNQHRFVGIVRNITERKQTEIALKQAKEQAESASRAKSEFLANMSHEIRTPLNAVIGFSELLFTLVTDKKQKNYLDSIQTAGKSLLTLINDILDLSKIEAGRLEFQYDVVNPRIIFNELQQIFALKIAEKNLGFRVAIDDNLPLTLMLDETRLRQVLLNLIGNAIKFTDLGYIQVSAHQAFHTENPNQVDFIIAVADTGIGIPEAQQEMIFDSFRQQDGQSTRKYGGTGLGLAITKRLVEMMNGQISLKSTVDKGSVFEIILQQVEVPPTSAILIEDNTLDFQRISFKKACVLVVDDIESNRTLLKEWLSQANLDVIEADDGQSALFFVSEYHPNLILMDIRMPGIDGYEATKQIKANPATQDIPVIAVTASLVTAETQANIGTYGFDGYLSKPVDMPKLFRELSHHLEYTQQPAQPAAETEAAITVKREPLKELETLDILKLTQLMDTLEKEIMPVWKELEGVIETEIIDDFAQKLMVLGKAYNMPSFCHYGESLYDCAAEFNITAIQDTLVKFPLMVQQLQCIIDRNVSE